MDATSCTLYGRRVVMADLDISNVIDSMTNDAKKRLSKKTNADKIRAMSDEELADFINTVANDSIDTITAYGTKSHTEIWEDKETTMYWLQSEAE
jgi:Glu-tRNA(Gln) amidotransferase subunit E-like FAD-binding protein